MRVSVRLFAMLRERAGAREVTLDLPDGASVGDALARLADIAAGLPVVLAVNRRYADDAQELHEGDELALIPPVSGGQEAVSVSLTGRPLSHDDILRAVADPAAGAIVLFAGVTREVDHLEYEAYEEMALECLRDVARAALGAHDVCRVAAVHRVGTVPLGEPSVLVAASAAHRPAAFAAAAEMIDAIKARAPIFKAEVQDGSRDWVGGTPPR